jgi:hypothetical protein
MIYVTLLPTGIVKIGRGTRISRASFAQVYFVEPVKVLAVWETDNDKATERAALAICRPYRVKAELHQGDPQEMVAALVAHLGPPTLLNPPRYSKGRPRRGEVRVGIAKPAHVQAQDLMYHWKHYKSRKRCDLI